MTSKGVADERSRRRTATGENRLPPALAVVAALVVYVLLPSSLRFLGRFVIPDVEALLLVALIVTNPRRITRQTRWPRTVSIGLAVLVIVSNLLSLGLLTADLSNKSPSGENLLVGAMQIWVTTVIGLRTALLGDGPGRTGCA